MCTHTDGAPYSKTHSCTTINFSALLSKGDEKLNKYPCASFIKLRRDSGNPGAWAHLVADFEALAEGRDSAGGGFVSLHSDGTPWRFALLFAKADEEARCNDFGLPHFAGKIEV